jgi:hypothetical protein
MIGEVHSPAWILDEALVLRLKRRSESLCTSSFGSSRSVEGTSIDSPRASGIVQCNYAILISVAIAVSDCGHRRSCRVLVA